MRGIRKIIIRMEIWTEKDLSYVLVDLMNSISQHNLGEVSDIHVQRDNIGSILER